jgi:hypothetical protein
MAASPLADLLVAVQAGTISLDQAAEQIVQLCAPTQDVGQALVDLDRRRRCGYPEVIYGAGKTADAVLQVVAAQQSHGQPSLITRCSLEQAAAVTARYPAAHHNPIAGTIRLDGPSATVRHGAVAVLAAGTTDRPVAEEAVETASWMGCATTLIMDVGVAGPHRLVERLSQFQHAAAVIVVAGMEGALPSVVAGWVACPVIAVPTSVGYGAHLFGMAALLSMLNSCAANVAVVNIDAGFKAGYLAGLIASGHDRRDLSQDV